MTVGVAHPLPLDPAEELCFRTDWTLVLSETEKITRATSTPSSEAILDEHMLASVRASQRNPDFTPRVVTSKRTGGLTGHSYVWIEVIDTIDWKGHARRRKRTIIVDVANK